MRMVKFLTVVLSLWTVMNFYVFWRLSSLVWVMRHFGRVRLVVVAALLWACYPLARFFYAWDWVTAAKPLEWVGSFWIGVLFLLFLSLLLTDLVTAGGWLVPRLAPKLRTGALTLAGVLALIGLVQGLRPPVVSHYEIALPTLPRQHDGLVVVQVTDLHLGTMIGQNWLARLIEHIKYLQPDLVVIVGDLVDGNVAHVEPILPVLKTLQAPLGVYAVAGNHEFYAGLDRSIQLLRNAGFTVLRDQWVEAAPGLVLAGVDDLTARRQFGLNGQPIEQALSIRPTGATILLSHSPLQMETAAAAGVDLMLCGHTHNGQIWPFNYFVRTVYPLLKGYHRLGSMQLIICRGTGTWGPRMRLWQPGEIVRIRLRSAAKGS